MSTVLIFLVVIVILVVVHELGHFSVAKLFGIHVEEFGVGYPPRAKKLFTWKGTLFTLNWLPFGGFVKIFGETKPTEERKGSFIYQKKWKRALVILAGIVANMLLAIVLYAISFSIGFTAPRAAFPEGIYLGPEQTIISGVIKGMPAEKAKIKAGEAITHLSSGEDTLVPTGEESVISFIRSHVNEPVTLTLSQQNQERTVIVTPVINPQTNYPGIGVDLTAGSYMRLRVDDALLFSPGYAIVQFNETVKALGVIIQKAFTGGGALSNLAGPVGIAQIAKQAYMFGIGAFLAFMALISVNLAVINLLPFPALDGGRLILELFSNNGKSKIPQNVVTGINLVGFALLILLMVVITFNDIARIFA